MNQKLAAFNLKIGVKNLDYRVGQTLNLAQVKSFFELNYTSVASLPCVIENNYKVKKIWSAGRHVLGILEKDNKEYFLKLATTEGISIMTKNEAFWNEEFNRRSKSKKFRVARNFKTGYWGNSLFYLICEKLEGNYLWGLNEKGDSTKALLEKMTEVIEFSEYIQGLKIPDLELDRLNRLSDYQKRFVEKTRAWYSGIPKRVCEEFKIEKLLVLVKNGAKILEKNVRHGDFTPWHLLKPENGDLALIDGEHAMKGGVEGYDICYFIQRVFSVFKNPTAAERFWKDLIKRGYHRDKLKTVLASRAIGGYLDESLAPTPDYSFALKFQKWILSI